MPRATLSLIPLFRSSRAVPLALMSEKAARAQIGFSLGTVLALCIIDGSEMGCHQASRTLDRLKCWSSDELRFSVESRRLVGPCNSN